MCNAKIKTDNLATSGDDERCNCLQCT